MGTLYLNEISNFILKVSLPSFSTLISSLFTSAILSSSIDLEAVSTATLAAFSHDFYWYPQVIDTNTLKLKFTF